MTKADFNLIDPKIQQKFEACLDEEDMTALLNFVAPVNSSYQDPECPGGSFILAGSNKMFLNQTFRRMVNEISSCPPCPTASACPTCPSCPACPTCQTCQALPDCFVDNVGAIGPAGYPDDTQMGWILQAVNPLITNNKTWQAYVNFPNLRRHSTNQDYAEHMQEVLRWHYHHQVQIEVGAAISQIETTCGGGGSGSPFCAICDFLTCANPVCSFTDCC